MKAQIQTLTTERDEAVTAKSPLQDLINTLQEQVKESEEKWQGSRAKLVEQFKARSRELSAKIQGGAADSIDPVPSAHGFFRDQVPRRTSPGRVTRRLRWRVRGSSGEKAGVYLPLAVA